MKYVEARRELSKVLVYPDLCLDYVPLIKFDEFKKQIVEVRTGNRLQAFDMRTRLDPERETFLVKPLMHDYCSVYIICPFCHEVHSHGYGQGDYAGSRVPHCYDPWRKLPESLGMDYTLVKVEEEEQND